MSINNTSQGADLVNSNQAQAAKMGITIPGATPVPTTITDNLKNNLGGTSTTSPTGKDVFGNPVVVPTSGSTTPVTGTSNGTTGTDPNSPVLADQADRTALTQAQADLQTASKKFQDTVTGIQNGAIPLSASEQAQVDALNGQYQKFIQDQKDANDLQVQQQNILDNRQGRTQYMPGAHLETIRGIMENGATKVQALAVEQAGKVAELTQALKDKDIAAIKTSFDALTTASKDRQDALKQTITDTQTAIDKANAAKEQDKKDALDALIHSDTVSYQDKQQAIAEAQLSETVRHNKATEAAQSQVNLLGNIPAPVTMTSHGSVNAGQQAAFLAQLPGGPNGELATTVKHIADYSESPTTASAKPYKGAGMLSQQQMLALVYNYDPSYKESQYSTRQALVKNFTSGTYSQNINALNTVSGHLTELSNDVNKLGNANFKPYNIAKNTVGPIFGYSPPAGVVLDIGAVSDELATALKKSGATDVSIKALGSLNQNSTPADKKAYIESAAGLLGERLSALEDTYVAGMGKSPDKGFLQPNAAQSLLNLQKEGYDIKVPELMQMPQVQLQTFNDSSPDNASILQQMIAADPTLANDPQRAIQWLQQGGYMD